MSERHTIAIAVAVICLLVLVVQFAYDTDTRYHKPLVTVTEPPAHRWTPDDEIQHESEQRLAAAMSNVNIADGFIITNYSDVALTTVVFSCKVDGAEQVFEWDQKDAVVSTMDRIPAFTQYAPSKLVYRLETRKQFEDLETNGIAILDGESMTWLLEHHKVTGCNVFQIGTDWK